MAKFLLHISQTGHDTIKIEADVGIIIDDWKELTAQSCLIVPNGGFKIEANEVVFSSKKTLNFKLFGKPFEADVGDTGDAYIELAKSGCPNDGWTWTLVLKP